MEIYDDMQAAIKTWSYCAAVHPVLLYDEGNQTYALCTLAEAAEYCQRDHNNQQASRSIEVHMYGAYNNRRYGRPWAAVVTAWSNGTPELDFSAGEYLGTESGGRLEVTCQVGDIIRWGHKDHRGNNTQNYWAIVNDDWSLRDCTPTEAKDHWRAS